MKKAIAILGIILLFVSGCKENFIFPEDGLIDNADGKMEDLKAVGRYQGLSSCTAVFVKVSDDVNAPAYVFTNAHCVQGWEANKIYQDVPAENHKVTFNMFQNTPASQRVVADVKRIAYSTMKGTDIGIVELKASVKDLMDKGIKPLKIASEIPKTGQSIKIYGVPVDGVDVAEHFLRQSSCEMGQKTNLIEFDWTWWDMYANQCANIKGGSSGSPVLSNLKDGVFGLINTTTIGAGSPCYLGGPCEVLSGTVTMKESTSYTLSIVGMKACFNTSGVFDLNVKGCGLEKPGTLELVGSPMGAINPETVEINGRPKSQNWDYTVSGVNFYKYKIGKLGESDPRDLNGYSKEINSQQSPKIQDLLPKEAGHYYLAVMGGNSATMNDTWQNVKQPVVVRLEIDKTPPTMEPIIQVNDWEDEYVVSLGFVPPELSNYVIKAGPPEETDENDPADYMLYRRVPISVYKDELPIKICVIGYDNAGNATPPKVLILK